MKTSKLIKKWAKDINKAFKEQGIAAAAAQYVGDARFFEEPLIDELLALGMPKLFIERIMCLRPGYLAFRAS